MTVNAITGIGGDSGGVGVVLGLCSSNGGVGRWRGDGGDGVKDGVRERGGDGGGGEGGGFLHDGCRRIINFY